MFARLSSTLAGAAGTTHANPIVKLRSSDATPQGLVWQTAGASTFTKVADLFAFFPMVEMDVVATSPRFSHPGTADWSPSAPLAGQKIKDGWNPYLELAPGEMLAFYQADNGSTGETVHRRFTFVVTWDEFTEP